VVAHDHRQYWSVVFGEIVAGTGPSIQGSGVDRNAEPELGFPETTPGPVYKVEDAVSKVAPVRATLFAKLFWDGLGTCMFSARAVKDSLRLTTKSLVQTVGWEDFDTQESLAVGERIANLMRLVYARRGFQKADELDISEKHLEPPPAGPSKGLSIGPYLPAMVDEYYVQMGWNVDTGFPTPETLRRLGMEEFLGDVGGT
jgi:aldehyde:ferredoxin oxidoreductase